MIGRDIVLRESYGFLAIGGGTSDLTIANRLTENPDSASLLLSVALPSKNSKRSCVFVQKHRCSVIEYGYLDRQPANIYVPGLLNATEYVSHITSTRKAGLVNLTSAVPAAAVVGGGMIVKGMFSNRGSAPDYDAWVEVGNPR